VQHQLSRFCELSFQTPVFPPSDQTVQEHNNTVHHLSL
jgi:hypothetical protein